MVRKGFFEDILIKTNEAFEMRRNGAQRSLREEYEVDEKSLCRGAGFGGTTNFLFNRGAGEDGDKEDQTAVLLTQLFDNRPVTHVLKEAKFCFPADAYLSKDGSPQSLAVHAVLHIKKDLYNLFPYQSPEEIDKEKVHLSDSERKMDPAEDDTNVYTEKHSDNLFKRTEVLAAVIAGGVIGFLFAIFLILLLVYRMRKKDEGSYDLGERKPSSAAYQKAPTKEFYA
ncbi:syndecan-2 [Leptonychotes weddellii]|uniref:Syndecan n=1 Tax=Leptonychotes weddellii TaxID=9713 RepID=A0A2U3YVQ7_LEPWE|nr:syndecan-2 [Leptonychotes weddellii]